MKFFILLFFISFQTYCLGQQGIYKMKIPKTLEKCFPILDKTMIPNKIEIIKNTEEDSIHSHEEFKYGNDFFHAWKLYDGSKLTKYFNKKGLFGAKEIYATILISYHRYLNGEPIELENQIDKIKRKKEIEQLEYIERIKKDSINGVYIPKDIQECFIALDSILSDEDKKTIKELENRDKTIQYHHELGRWLRNSWSLWGGSRLQQYFTNRKIYHPDSMSSLILEFYYDWLNGNHTEWEKFDKN